MLTPRTKKVRILAIKSKFFSNVLKITIMKKVFAIIVIAGTLAACNNGTDGNSTSGDSAVLTTPSTVDSTTVTTPMDTSAVAPLVDTTTSGTGSANSSTSGLGATGSGTTKAADSAGKKH
jgi:hypothetical protein